MFSGCPKMENWDKISVAQKIFQDSATKEGIV